MFGHLASGLIKQIGGVTFIATIQLVGSIMTASFSQGSDSTGTGSCVPAWCFASVLQPIISLIVCVHQFAILNIAIERDIDQDIVEMNIRLTFSDSHVPNWLLQQMICLERLDGRAFSLPFNIIPSLDMSRSLASNFIASLLFLGPYLVSIRGQLTSEIICPLEA